MSPDPADRDAVSPDPVGELTRPGTTDELVSAADAPPWDRVEVVRSRRRRRTVASEVRDGALVVWVPAWMSTAEVETWVDTMGRRHRRRHSTERVDLESRARRLARAHDLPRPASITWSERMERRWGSCSPADGSIRISAVLATYPDWVLDYVIVHELAHLAVAGHGPDFWALVERYPRSERAIGYLIAKSDGTAEPPPTPTPAPTPAPA